MTKNFWIFCVCERKCQQKWPRNDFFASFWIYVVFHEIYREKSEVTIN